MRRRGMPFLAVPALAVVLGLGGFCTRAEAQDPAQPAILAGLTALSQEGMAGVSAKGFAGGAPTLAAPARPSLQLWDEVRPLARPVLPGQGSVLITVGGSP